jgi:hypothetical protein
MDRETVSGGVSFLMAAIIAVFPSEVGDFINSIFPNAGYYTVRVGFAVAFGYGVFLVVHKLRKRKKSKLTTKPHAQQISEITPVVSTAEKSEQNERPAVVDRWYGSATLKFKISTTTDWIEIGLSDSKQVTVNNHDLLKGTIQSIEEPNSSHLRIDLRGKPDEAITFLVSATFEAYAGGPIFVFVRKGDHGTLRVDVLNENDKLLFEMPEYGRTAQKYNYKDFGFDFDYWD